jgi:hypothetical protein
MPAREPSSFMGLVVDLYRETSFSVFFCTVCGMVLGVVATVALLMFWLYALFSLSPPDTQLSQPYGVNSGQPVRVVPVRGGPGPVAFLLVVPGVVVGGTLGCLFGVVLDCVVNLIRGPQEKKRRRKPWDPEREAARRQKREQAEPRPEKNDIGSHWQPDERYSS